MKAVWLYLLAACGDSASDPAQPVRVTITAGEMPRVGVVVVFEDAHRLVETVTDADGVALAYVDDAAITAIDPFVDPTEEPFEHDVYTTIGANAGESLVFYTPSGITSNKTMTILAPDYPNGNEYTIDSQCVSTQIPEDHRVQFLGCRGQQDLLVNAYELAGPPQGSIVRDAVPIVDGATVDLRGESYRPLLPMRLELSNVPPSVTSIGFAGMLRSGTPIQFVLEGAAVIDNNRQWAAVGTRSDIGTRDAVLELALMQSFTPFQSLSIWGPWEDAREDASTLLLPIDTPAYDFLAHAFTWSVADPRDYITGHFRCTRGTDRWTWRFIGPAPSDGIALPRLPGDLGKYMPTSTDACSPSLDFTRVTNGYDAIRSRAWSGDARFYVNGDRGRAVTQRALSY